MICITQKLATPKMMKQKRNGQQQKNSPHHYHCTILPINRMKNNKQQILLHFSKNYLDKAKYRGRPNHDI